MEKISSLFGSLEPAAGLGTSQFQPTIPARASKPANSNSNAMGKKAYGTFHFWRQTMVPPCNYMTTSYTQV
jgi:hypothetical protein